MLCCTFTNRKEKRTITNRKEKRSSSRRRRNVWFMERVEDAARDIFAGRRALETPVDLPVEPTFVNMEIDASSQ